MSRLYLGALVLLLVLVQDSAALKVRVPQGATECVTQSFTDDQFQVIIVGEGPGLQCTKGEVTRLNSLRLQVPGGARVEGALFVNAYHPQHTSNVAVRVSWKPVLAPDRSLAACKRACALGDAG